MHPIRYILAVLLIRGCWCRSHPRLAGRSSGGASAHPLISAARHYVFPEQLGVHHFLLPSLDLGGGDTLTAAAAGAVAAASGGAGSAQAPSTAAVNLHVFLRGVVAGDRLLLRGFVYADNVTAPQLSANSKLTTPLLLTKWAPTITAAHDDDSDGRSDADDDLAEAEEGEDEDEGSGGEAGGSRGDGGRRGRRSNVLRLRITPASDFSKPLSLAGALPLARAGAYSLRVEGVARAAPLAGVVAAAMEQAADDPPPPPLEADAPPPPTRQQQQQQPPRLYTVIGSWAPPSRHALAAALLRAHVEWHRRLGFEATLAYLRPAVLAALAGDVGIGSAVRGRCLVLVAWAGYLPHVPDAPDYDQSVIYNHALLALWRRSSSSSSSGSSSSGSGSSGSGSSGGGSSSGSGDGGSGSTWVFLADVDSFLAVPGGPLPVSLLMAPRGGDSDDQNDKGNSFAASVPGSHSADGEASDVAAAAAAAVGCLKGVAQNKLRLYRVVCAACANSDEPEEGRWVGEKASDSGGGSQGGSSALAPLTHYTLRANALSGVRSLADPDAITQFFLFDGVAEPESRDSSGGGGSGGGNSAPLTAVADESCAFVASLSALLQPPPRPPPSSRAGAGMADGATDAGTTAGAAAAAAAAQWALPSDLQKSDAWLWPVASASSSSSSSSSGSSGGGGD